MPTHSSNQPQQPAASKPKGGRTGGRTTFQLEKKRRTRETILAAASKIFSEKPYIFATIDEIIRASGVSRATFYMHFETKLALAIAIYEEIGADWLELFNELADLKVADTDALVGWLERLVEVYVAHGYISSMVVQLNVFEEEFHARLAADRDWLIDRLATQMPAFRCTWGDDEQARRARVAARLLLQRIDQVCSELTLRTPPDADIYLRLLAEELAVFLGRTA